MRILTRYVLLELLKVYLLTLISLTLIIFVVLIGKEAIDKGIGLGALLTHDAVSASTGNAVCSSRHNVNGHNQRLQSHVIFQ